jgi:2-polyprenyl-6-hydroxyphenyl methylase/3-demethylubiquinone-9 3-methyltransferase
MPSRDYHEDVWAAVPPGLAPSDLGLRSRFLLERVPAGAAVLDVGCGEGVFARALEDAGARVTAIDVAEEPLRRARERAPGLDLRLARGEADWELPDGAFDLAWAGEVIEHVADTGAWLGELSRVLRPGGMLLLSTPDHGPLTRARLALSERAFAERFDPRSDHLRFFTRRSLRLVLELARFEQVEVRGAGGFPGARRLLLAAAVRPA